MAGFINTFLLRVSMRLRCRNLVAASGWLAWAASLSVSAAPPFLSMGNPTATNSSALQLTLTGDTNYAYVIQASTDLQNWNPLLTNRTIGTDVTFTASVPSAGGFSFYRAKSLGPAFTPYFNMAIVTKYIFDAHGNNFVIDSFDSTTPLYSIMGQWDLSKRKANGDVAVASGIVGNTNIGNGNIYGHVITGPGSAQNMVQIGLNGAIGDVAWNASHSGIQSGYWLTNFNVNIPDVVAPNTAGWLTSLPPADTNGSITLNGGNYVVIAGPTSPLNITGPTVLWVKGSVTLGATIATTNNARLMVYIGTTAGTSNSFTVSGNGTVNQPGYAANLQIYGLPSLTSISISGTAGFIGAIYAPEANFSGGGGGNNTKDCSGAMVLNSITLKGHWNFHYDESLKNSGIGY